MSIVSDATQKLSATQAAAARAPASACKTITSHELFKGSRELLIDHDGCQYRLRQTSKGKLILTK